MSPQPLPSHPWRLAPIWDEDEQKVLQAYGQQCRDAALEDAAQVCDERANGENDAQYCADRIRSLKS